MNVNKHRTLRVGPDVKISFDQRALQPTLSFIHGQTLSAISPSTAVITPGRTASSDPLPTLPTLKALDLGVVKSASQGLSSSTTLDADIEEQKPFLVLHKFVLFPGGQVDA